MNQVLYRGKVWYAYDTIEGYKLTSVKGRDTEILSSEEYDYALMRGDIKMLEKDKNMEKQIIEIQEEVTIGNQILEVGDKIEVMNEGVIRTEIIKAVVDSPDGPDFGSMIGLSIVKALKELKKLKRVNKDDIRIIREDIIKEIEKAK